MTQQIIINVFLASAVPRGALGCSKPPEIPKALQIRTKINPILKTVQNC